MKGRRKEDAKLNTHEEGKKSERRRIPKQGSGGVSFIVKEYLCDTIAVIKDTKIDESYG